MEALGWVRLHKTFLDAPVWEFAKDYHYPEVIMFWNCCLLSANWKDVTWYDGKGEITIKKGSFVSSIDSISKKTGLSRQTVRNCIRHCENMKMLTHCPTYRYSVFSIVNWVKYQPPQHTGQPRANHEPTPVLEYKNNKNIFKEKEINKEKEKDYPIRTGMNEKLKAQLTKPKGGQNAGNSTLQAKSKAVDAAVATNH